MVDLHSSEENDSLIKSSSYLLLYRLLPLVLPVLGFGVLYSLLFEQANTAPLMRYVAWWSNMILRGIRQRKLREQPSQRQACF